MTKKENNADLIKKTTADLLDLLTIPAEIVIEETETDVYKVDLQAENTGLLIGFHGETLYSLQMIISLILYKKIGRWLKISLNAGNYREYREEQIKDLVNRIIEEVKLSGEPKPLPYLNGSERRIVHLLLLDNSEVLSESEGEGYNRRVFIKPKVKTPVSS